ncbi:hypothetical protein LOTGIDRAFT_235434 [Lottia gigantea]|uniref:Uncharacterized protein n=1 Tax=Lottia gigantea TaxID=225164 RepID=V3ZV03_LOTGI|nr:hypothetical protein LOTGIDRAFT_235434 [Lottia gigantea]ESO86375.1 hypothetical protein LOTGIDRAFT_235434 [Lottia gigantea]
MSGKFKTTTMYKHRTRNGQRMFGGMSQDVDRVLPEHIQDKSPPPSYEEVIGQHQSSLKQDQNELPPLSYIDIMPRCLEVGAVDRKVPPKFEPFSAIIENANEWLRCNSGMKVWRCETVERKIEKGTIVNLDSTLIHESTYGFNVYVIGLRLWLTKKSDEKTPTQQLAVYNVIPQEKEVPIRFSTRFGGGSGIVGGAYIVGPGLGRGIHTQITTWTTYEGLNKTLERTNEELKTSPLPGKY